MQGGNKINLGLIIFLIAISPVIHAQESTDKLYVFDANWKGTDVQHAQYLLRIKKISDSTWQWDTYNILGPLIKTELFKDPDGNVAEGQVYFYNASGSIDSIHNYKNGLAHGEWYYKNDTGRVTIVKVFSNGILREERNLIMEDSINNLRGTNEKEGDSKTIEKESEFPGGQQGWAKYLNKSVLYPDRAYNNKIQGMVQVQFIIDTNGNVIEPRIAKSVEFSLDEEALRLIRRSPKWIPAEQKGRKVKSYKLQPVVFQL